MQKPDLLVMVQTMRELFNGYDELPTAKKIGFMMALSIIYYYEPEYRIIKVMVEEYESHLKKLESIKGDTNYDKRTGN